MLSGYRDPCLQKKQIHIYQDGLGVRESSMQGGRLQYLCCLVSCIYKRELDSL